MKRLSIGLAILVLGALPLTAAAFDYGSDHPLLAAETGAPPFPDARQHAMRIDPSPEPAVTTIDDRGAPQGVAQAQPGPEATMMRADRGASTSIKPAAKTANDAAPVRPTWQSLLPGSIQ